MIKHLEQQAVADLEPCDALVELRTMTDEQFVRAWVGLATECMINDAADVRGLAELMRYVRMRYAQFNDAPQPKTTYTELSRVTPHDKRRHCTPSRAEVWLAGWLLDNGPTDCAATIAAGIAAGCSRTGLQSASSRIANRTRHGIRSTWALA